MSTSELILGIAILLLALIAICIVFFKTRRWSKLFGEQQAFYVKIVLLAVIAAVAIFGELMVFLDPGNRGHLLTIVGIVGSIGIALASTPFLSNAMAGLMLIAGRTFRPGDYLEVKEYFGRVTKRRLFYLQIQTPDRDLQTLPNLFVVSNPHKVINQDGTFIGCEVSLGYNAPYDEVQECLITAALAAQLEDPYVKILKLNDYSITYRVAGLLTDVRYIISERSNLARLVVNALHSADIEIVSPMFMNQRQISEDKVKAADDGDHAGPRIHKSRPEDLIFDEAEKVARIERLNDKYKKLKQELDKIRADKHEVENPHRHSMMVARKERDLKILENIIEKQSKAVEE